MSSTATVIQPVAVKNIPIERKEDAFELSDELYNRIAARAYAIFQGDGGNFGHELDHWFQAEAQLLHPAHVRVTEQDKIVTVEAEVPGFGAKELAIGLEGCRLTIAGKREAREEQKKGKTIYQEHCSEQILRVLELPAGVNGEAAKATLRNGMLEIQIPEASHANVKRIGIEVTG